MIAKDVSRLPEGARYQGDTFNVAPGERLTVVEKAVMESPGPSRSTATTGSDLHIIEVTGRRIVRLALKN